MNKNTFNIKISIVLLILVVSIFAKAETASISTNCDLNSEITENPEKPNHIKNTTTIVNKKSTAKKQMKSNKLGVLKLLIPDTLR